MSVHDILVESWYGPPLLAGILYTILDLLLNVIFASSLQSFGNFFVSKFLIATLVALVMGFTVGSIAKGGFIGGIVVAIADAIIYYYAVIANYSSLTCCISYVPQLSGVPNGIWFRIGGTFGVTASAPIWFFIHVLLFLVSYGIIFKIAGDSR